MLPQDPMTMIKSRLDTRLPKSRAGGQGPYLRSLDYLGRSEVIEVKFEKSKMWPTDQRTDGRTNKQVVESRAHDKKANYLFISVSHPSNEKYTAKSMIISKLSKSSFKLDLAGCPSSIRLQRALGWRQTVKNLEIHYVIFMGHLCSKIKRM